MAGCTAQKGCSGALHTLRPSLRRRELAALMSFRQSRARLLLSLRSTWASKLLSRTYSTTVAGSPLKMLL